MSHVDNVILAFGSDEDFVELENSDHYPIMDQVNAWLREHAAGQQFGPDLGSVEAAYGGHKNLEPPMFVAAFNYVPEDDFIAFLRTLPWKHPADVQYIVHREHGERFEIVHPFQRCT